MEKYILIMAKAPVPGAVKTRMNPFLTESQSAELAESMLVDTLRLCEAYGAKVVVGYAPADRREEFQQLVGTNTKLVAQDGTDLGQRMTSVFSEIESGAAGVMIGTDTPTLSKDDLDAAFEHLVDTDDIVLGPTVDGGFYLVGLRQFKNGLFDRVSWSTDSALAETVRNAESLGYNAHRIRRQNDLDAPDDLIGYYRERVGGAGALDSWIDENAQLFQM